ncbi:phage holin family protein [Candidatus Gracilibacteria bacterium]|nr:phage holin family protein [Candidatus Gracilibacteria bacterium]
MRFLLRFLFTAIAIYLLMYYNYLPGISLTDGTNSLLIFTFILGLVNLVIGGILRLITLPLRILSLGLIGFIISIVVVILTDEFVTGIHITGWTTIILVALTMSIVSMILS